MGFIGKIIQHFLEDAIRETVTEIYPNYTKSSVLCLPAGIDSVPILGDQSIENDDKFDTQILIDIDNAGHSASVGVIPPSLVQEGQIKLYGRDPKTGQIVSYVLCYTDGNLELNGTGDFAVRYSELETAFNQLKSDFDSHTHPYNPGPGASSPTGTTVASTADISLAKIENIIVSEVPN